MDRKRVLKEFKLKERMASLKMRLKRFNLKNF
jgi:hypothetical protein